MGDFRAGLPAGTVFDSVGGRTFCASPAVGYKLPPRPLSGIRTGGELEISAGHTGLGLWGFLGGSSVDRCGFQPWRCGCIKFLGQPSGGYVFGRN